MVLMLMVVDVDLRQTSCLMKMNLYAIQRKHTSKPSLLSVYACMCLSQELNTKENNELKKVIKNCKRDR